MNGSKGKCIRADFVSTDYSGFVCVTIVEDDFSGHLVELGGAWGGHFVQDEAKVVS